MSKLKITSRSLSLFPLLFLTFFLIFILPSYSLYSKNCHYTCTYCIGSQYDHCIICQQGLQLTAIKNRNNINQQYYNRLEDHPWGSCLGGYTQTPTLNIFGIATFTIVTLMLVLIRNRTMFYFLNAFQTLALLSLIQIAQTPLISYVLQGLEYFMLVSTMNNKFTKIEQSQNNNLEIFDDGRYRMYQFQREYNFFDRFLSLFLFSLAAFILTFLMPLCKHFSRQQGSLWTICSCINITKAFTLIEISSITIFFFLIQQSILMIVIGIFLNQKFIDDSSNIALVIIYALIFTLMMINICSKNLDLFPNKASQMIEIAKKCITPVFVIVPVKVGVVLAGFGMFVGLLGVVFGRIRRSEKTLTQFHQKLIKRELVYRIVEILVIGSVISFWLVQSYVSTLSANSSAGIAVVVVVGSYILCFLIQVTITLYGKYYKKQDQRLYQIFTNSLSSMRQAKMVEQTISNFQTTEQGIMDMIFFGRNLQQKQSPNKKTKNNNNIQLDLDNLINEQQHDTNHGDGKSSRSATTSMKNRDLRGKTTRTPKYDRSSRFRLNKAFEPENKEIQIEYVQMKEEILANNNNEHQSGQKSHRSQVAYSQPKTTRKDHGLRIDLQSKTMTNEEEEKRSPRFGYNNQESETRLQKQGKTNNNYGKEVKIQSRKSIQKGKKYKSSKYKGGKSSLN